MSNSGHLPSLDRGSINNAVTRFNKALRLIAYLTALLTLVVGGYAAFIFGGDTHRVGGAGVSIKYFESDSSSMSLGKVRQAVDSSDRREINVFERDPEKPLVMEIRPDTDSGFHLVPQVVEIRLVRGERYRLWTMSLPTEADRASGEIVFADDISESLNLTSSGAAFQLPAQSRPYRILAAIDSNALWKPKVYLWPSSDFSEIVDSFDRFGGALMGLFLGLAAFSAVVATLNKNITFLLFAAWLITSLRLAVFNGGWDLQWIGVDLPDSATFLLMQVSLAVHGLLSCALFQTLFSVPLRGTRIKTVTKVLMSVFSVLAIIAPWIGYSAFMLAFYCTAAIALPTFVIGTALMLVRKPTATAGWYLISYTVWMLGIMSEMFYQAGILQGLTSLLNIQTSSILAALIMGVALAEQMRQDRTMRLTARKREVEALQMIERNYQNTPVSLFSLNPDYSMRISNRAFREQFKLESSKPAGDVRMEDLIGAVAFSQVRAGIDGRDMLSILVSCEQLDRLAWYTIELSRKDGRFEGSIQDVTARKAAEDKLTHLVDHDALTGALNRRGYEAALLNALGQTGELNNLVIAEININRFSQVGTLYGSSTMDKVLLELNNLIRTNIGQASVARIAESFRLIIKNVPTETVLPRLESLVRTIADASPVPNRAAVSLNVSIGVLEVKQKLELDQAQAYLAQACTLARKDEKTPVVLLSDEDQALAQGFESVKAFSDIDTMPLEDRFFLVLQPIVPVQRQGDLLKFEVLLRMRSESGGLIRPDRFIPAAEEAGIMNRIDRWVVEQTLNLLDETPLLCDNVDMIAVNLSGSSLNDPKFVSQLLEILFARPKLATKLCLEVTESVALNDVVRTREFLETIRLMGIKVALDDFGSGYTGWGYLQHLPADVLKLDGSIVRDCLNRSVDRLIIKSAVELARELGMTCVAEMAETEETVILLQELGVDFVQGYYFSRPLPVDEIKGAGADLKQLLLAPVPKHHQVANRQAQTSAVRANSQAV